MTLSATISGNTLTITATGIAVGNADRLAQVIATMPTGRDLGAVVQHGADGSLTANIPYEGPGPYTIKVYDKDGTVPIAQWSGQLPLSTPRHK